LTVAVPGVPPPLDAAILRALAKNPDERFAHLGAFAAANAPFGSPPAAELADDVAGSLCLAPVQACAPACPAARHAPALAPPGPGAAHATLGASAPSPAAHAGWSPSVPTPQGASHGTVPGAVPVHTISSGSMGQLAAVPPRAGGPPAVVLVVLGVLATVALAAASFVALRGGDRAAAGVTPDDGASAAIAPPTSAAAEPSVVPSAPAPPPEAEPAGATAHRVGERLRRAHGPCGGAPV